METFACLNRLAIIGLGLMGGSLGMAVKRKRMAKIVTGFARREKTRSQALERGVVDQVYSCLDRAVQGADLVVFCTPVGVISELVKACIPHFADHCVVTDVGSSKEEIVAQLEPVFKQGGSAYVGGHPITGSERHGLEAACPDLYEEAVVALTPTRRTDPAALKRVQVFWQGLGARVVIVSPEEHDRLVARTSHVPHLMAAMLASNVGRDRVDRVRDFCGPGFLDTTRIADGDPDLWRDIIRSNRVAVVQELKTFEQQIRHVTKLLESGDFAGLRRFLKTGRERRWKLQGGRK